MTDRRFVAWHGQESGCDLCTQTSLAHRDRSSASVVLQQDQQICFEN